MEIPSPLQGGPFCGHYRGTKGAYALGGYLEENMGKLRDRDPCLSVFYQLMEYQC